MRFIFLVRVNKKEKAFHFVKKFHIKQKFISIQTKNEIRFLHLTIAFG
jgi:hypothetical protein